MTFNTPSVFVFFVFLSPPEIHRIVCDFLEHCENNFFFSGVAMAALGTQSFSGQEILRPEVLAQEILSPEVRIPGDPQPGDPQPEILSAEMLIQRFSSRDPRHGAQPGVQIHQ